jgi:hypothetical protein
MMPGLLPLGRPPSLLRPQRPSARLPRPSQLSGPPPWSMRLWIGTGARRCRASPSPATATFLLRGPPMRPQAPPWRRHFHRRRKQSRGQRKWPFQDQRDRGQQNQDQWKWPTWSPAGPRRLLYPQRRLQLAQLPKLLPDQLLRLWPQRRRCLPRRLQTQRLWLQKRKMFPCLPPLRRQRRRKQSRMGRTGPRPPTGPVPPSPAPFDWGVRARRKQLLRL